MDAIRYRGKTMLHISSHSLTAPNVPQHPVNTMLTLLQVTAGQAEILIDRHLYRVCPGDILACGPTEPAMIQALSTPVFEYVLLCFDPAFVSAGGRNTFDQHYLDIFYDRVHIPTHKIGHDSPESAEASIFFQKIMQELQDEQDDYAYRVKILLLQLLLTLLSYVHRDSAINSQDLRPSYENSTIERVIDYIEENISQAMTLSMFAQIAHMNPFYFSTFFKKHTSVSPMQYVLRARINRAIELLRETDKTILEVALLCGFNNTANFNKAFKKITGRTPSEFRSSSDS